MKRFLLSLCCCVTLLAPAVLEARTVNINTASAEALVVLLNEVTPQQARSIVAWRKRHGEFKRPEDLLLIRGVDAEFWLRNKDRIGVTSSTPDPNVEPD